MTIKIKLGIFKCWKSILFKNAFVTILLQKNNTWPLFQISWKLRHPLQLLSVSWKARSSAILHKSAEFCFQWSQRLRRLKMWLKLSQLAEIKSAVFAIWKFKKTIIPIIFVNKSWTFNKMAVQQVMFTNEF